MRIRVRVRVAVLTIATDVLYVKPFWSSNACFLSVVSNLAVSSVSRKFMTIPFEQSKVVSDLKAQVCWSTRPSGGYVSDSADGSYTRVPCHHAFTLRDLACLHVRERV